MTLKRIILNLILIVFFFNLPTMRLFMYVKYFILLLSYLHIRVVRFVLFENF